MFPFFFNLTRRIEPFFNMSQWIEPFSWIWPTELNLFSIWLKELNPFFTWLSELNFSFQKIWLTELNLFLSKKMTQRIEPFINTTHRIELFFFIWPRRIEPFFFLNVTFFKKKKNSKNWTLFQKNDSNKLNIFSCLTQRIEPSLTWLEELNLCFFQKNDSKNGNFLSMTQRIDSFLSVTQRIEFLSFFCFFFF